MAVKMDGLAAAIADALEEFQEETMHTVKRSVQFEATACVQILEATSPNLTGDYGKGWRKKTAYESPLDIRVQVYNKTDYQLTHLLENGHANKNGERTPAYPHIGAAADEVSEYLMRDVKIKVGKK